MNIKITVEYNGTNYSGWAKQPGKNTIQGKIEEAIYKITGNTVDVTGSGRTDAGVHSIGQVANFDIQTSIPVSKIKFALNQNLPSDIRVISSEMVDESFNARYSALRCVGQAGGENGCGGEPAEPDL